MNKSRIRMLVLSGVLSISGLLVAEFRAPFSIGLFGVSHLHSTFEREEEGGCIFDIWGVGYAKNARKTYVDKHGFDTENLSGLLFGKSSFRLEELHKDGYVASSGVAATAMARYPENPWIKISTIEPKVDYYEKGLMFGLHLGGTASDGKLHYGVRTKLPLRSIEVENDIIDWGEKLEDVYRIRRQQGTGGDAAVARLDFLSVSYNTSNVAAIVNGVNYLPARTDVFGVRVDTVAGAVPNYIVMGRPDGTPPPLTANWADTEANALAAASLPTTGEVAEGAIARFGGGVDYTGLGKDRVAQSKLFVMPHLDHAGTALQNKVLRKMNFNFLDESTKTFFDEKGISFDTQRKVGIGDFNATFYLGYQCGERLYVELDANVVVPTGRKNTTPNLLYLPNLGNNGHFEAGLGSSWKLDIARCCNLDLRGGFNFVFDAVEKRAPALENALIKNICDEKTMVDAKVRWSYIDARANLTFFHPDNECLGFMVGYNFYYKTKDTVKFTEETVKKVLLDTSTGPAVGESWKLSSDVAANRTNQILHKAQFELFHYFDCFELFLGGAQAFAGKNAPKESDWHIGMRIEF